MMSVETAPAPALPPELIFDYTKFITEDGKPLDGPHQYAQLRILPEALRMSWAGPGGDRPWVVFANVGVFYARKIPPIVPDVFISVEVANRWDSPDPENNSYFVWEIGKVPDVVFEFVSTTPGDEDTEKLKIYDRIGVSWYVLFDPNCRLTPVPLRVYERTSAGLLLSDKRVFPNLNLGVKIWQGDYEGFHYELLRWTDGAGELLATKEEYREAKEAQLHAEHERAELEAGRAEQVTRQRDEARLRAERLAEALRKMGVDPDQV